MALILFIGLILLLLLLLFPSYFAALLQPRLWSLDFYKLTVRQGNFNCYSDTTEANSTNHIRSRHPWSGTGYIIDRLVKFSQRDYGFRSSLNRLNLTHNGTALSRVSFCHVVTNLVLWYFWQLLSILVFLILNKPIHSLSTLVITNAALHCKYFKVLSW